MRRFLLNAVLMGSSLAALAVAPYPGKVMYTQPDGTQIEVTMKGNGQSIVYYSTADGQAMLPDAEGRLLPAAHDEVMQALSTNVVLQPLNEGLHTSYVSATGSPRVLVILVQFADVKFSVSDPLSYYNRWLNQQGFTENGNYGSVRDYFRAQSNEVFSPQFDVYGPVTMSSNRSAYSSTSNTYKMIHDACGALDSQIDFSTYDLNGDGNVDNVFAIFAGQGANYGAANSINPHNSTCPTGLFTKKTVDGKTLYHYACVSEQGYSTSQPDGIGTFVHEFSHTLGLPDFYNTNGQNDYTPGFWSIMDLGNYLGSGYSPCNYSAYERHAMGWLEYTTLSEPAYVKLRPMAEYNFACKIETGRDGDYYVLENRKTEGWDRGMYGSGMLIWHIDASDASALANNPNNDTSHMRVDLVEADNAVGRSYEQLLGDPWPGSSKNYLFNSTSTPAMVRWNASTGSGTTAVGKSVSGIFQMTDDDYIQLRYEGGSDEVIVDPAVVYRTVSVKASPAAGGRVYIGTDQNCTEGTFATGTDVKLNAEANSNYVFSNWSYNGTPIAYNRAPAIRLTTENAGEYVANFTKVGNEPDYCYPEGNSTYTNDEAVRGVKTFTVMDDKGSSLTVDGPGADNAHVLYTDRTSQVFSTEAGAVLSFDGTADNQAWMHSYVYIDFDNDGEFNVDQSLTAINGDLISHTGYTLNMKSDNSDTADPTLKSDGSAVDMGQIFNLPSYKLPADMTPGTYRMRFKNDWNSTDPCGRSADHLYGGQKSNFMAANGGCVIDLKINVKQTAAIDTVEADGIDANAQAEYYNLEGIRVASDNLTPGFYIVRRGNQTSKVFIAE